MHKAWNRSFLLLVIACTLFSDNLQARELFLKHFTVDQGLPSNEVYQIMEDKDGYLWVATDRGIVRFDGYSFEEVHLRDGAPINPAFGIYQGASGRIYFCGLGGRIAVYRQGGLHSYPHNKKLASLYPQAGLLVADALCEQGDSLWISYNNNLGNCFMLPGGEIVKQPKVPGFHFDLANRFYYYMLENGSSRRTYPLYINWEDGSDQVDSVGLESGKDYIRRPYFGRMNGWDLFSVGRKLLFFKNRKKQSEYIFSHNVLSFTVLDDQHLFIGFENGGAAIYEIGDAKLKGPLYKVLDNFSVTWVHEDRQGGFWFSTLENGLFYAYPSRVSYDMGGDKIAFIEGHNDTCYVGFQQGMIHAYYKGQIRQRFKVPLAGGELLSSGSFHTTGELIAATDHAFYIRQGNAWRRYPSSDRILLPVSATLIYGGGVVKPELHTYKIGSASPEAAVVFPKRIISMTADHKGYIWLGTIEGLYRYDQGNITDYGRNNSLFYDRIVSLSELPGGRLAVATLNNGLIIKSTDNTWVLNKDNGLATPIINSMRTQSDTIWLGTNKGITKVVPAGSSFVTSHYGSNYGLPTLDIHEFSIIDGWIYFKWLDRLVMVDISRLGNLRPPAPPFILSVHADGKPVGMARPEIPYRQGEIRISYNSINFARGAQQRYRYRLKGYDDRWHISDERQVVFNGLSPGEYEFQVQVADALGTYVNTSAGLEFEVIPAFWQQWWFRTLIVILLLACAVLIFRVRLHAVKKKNKLLLDLAENQQKALVQLVNPHFIFNVLNTAQAAILNEDKMNASSIISRFAKLMRLSLQLSHQKFVTLDQEIDLLKKYFELEMIRFPGKFTYDIYIGPDIDVTAVKIPSMLIQPFIENSIKHGIMHLRDRVGQIILSINRQDDLLVCAIEDNGIGREQSSLINANRLKNHHSIGIEITRQRLQLLHQEKRTVYHYEVNDRYDEVMAASGTCVVFSVPFNTEE